MQFEQVEQTLKLSGVLTMSTITESLVDDFLKLLQNNQITDLDLSCVTQADSACVSLLLCAQRTVLHKKQTLALHHLPSSTQDLLNLYELNQIIEPL